jgi:hypothetical protein
LLPGRAPSGTRAAPPPRLYGGGGDQSFQPSISPPK